MSDTNAEARDYFDRLQRQQQARISRTFDMTLGSLKVVIDPNVPAGRSYFQSVPANWRTPWFAQYGNLS